MATDFGEIAVRSIQITNSAGIATAADALPTYAVTLPDGTAGTPPAVQAGGLGEYFVNYIGPQAGRYEDTWTAAVGTLTVKFGPDTFHVRPATPGPAVSIADLRRHLTIRDLNPGRDEQLRDFLDAGTELAEDYTGRTYRRLTIAGELHDGGKTGLLLRNTPVLSIITVIESGATLAAANYTLDVNAGVLTRGSTATPLRWIYGIQNVAVTYLVGAASVKARVRLGILELSRHLWETQRGGSGQPRQSGAGDDWDPRQGFSIPRRVAEMLDFDRAPGF